MAKSAQRSHNMTLSQFKLMLLDDERKSDNDFGDSRIRESYRNTDHEGGY
jgi:hypothetical protein